MRYLLILLLLAAGLGCSSSKAAEQLVWTVQCSTGAHGVRFQATEPPVWADGLWTFEPSAVLDPNELLPDRVQTNAPCIVVEGFVP